ncbi:Transcriptional regulator [Stygiomarasmius scandens]|uniref:Transcriptional regulator n=1 Tax=Marasmiellus scandens TaxID=2682957 RepID=A0ABR1IUR1_9AGAR
MSTRLAPYIQPPPLKSSLFKNPPDGVPPTEELEALQAELKALKQKSMDRAKKAGEDLKLLEESMRRMKEKEKGKQKAVEKVKRERDFTPSLPDNDDARSVTSSSSKQRVSSHPLHSVHPSSSRSSLDPRSTEDRKKDKKKKRKRDDESDNDLERPRKATPVPLSHSLPPPKAIKSAIPSSSQSQNKTQSGPDFSVPPPYPLLDPRPPIPPPPIPGPSKPTEVMEDFSKLKPPSQTAVTTFYSSIEPYIRPIKEEDLGWLEYTADELEPFVMPRLGKYYLDQWEDDDARIARGLPRDALSSSSSGDPSTSAAPQAFVAPEPKWDPSTLSEPDLLVEEKGHGPLTERLISALLPMENHQWKGVKAAEDAMEGRPGGSGAAASRKEKMNVSDLEVRIRDTMRFHGLLGGIPDYSNKVDDPIATALRHAQNELRTVLATNKARKLRLAKIARQRLAYQEYVENRDAIDRNITNTFNKLQKKDAPKVVKKKKKDRGSMENLNGLNGDTNGTAEPTGPPPPCPAALGLGPDEENRLVVSDTLKELVRVRREWVDTVGGFFEEREGENPGLIIGFPKESVYEGIEEEIREIMKGLPVVPFLEETRGAQGQGQHQGMVNGTSGGKGKEKERGDEMDIG